MATIQLSKLLVNCFAHYLILLPEVLGMSYHRVSLLWESNMPLCKINPLLKKSLGEGARDMGGK